VGVLITFEGIEGCGKSTQAIMAEEALRKEGREPVVTREPGGTALGERVREILLQTGDLTIAPLTELLLYAACRAQLVDEVIAPALDAGKVVLCDRFADSTAAYQGYGRALGLDTVIAVNRQVLGKVRPHLTLLIDCEPEKGLERAWRRIKERGGKREDRFEREDIDFHRAVREGYREIARREPDRVVVVDGGRGADEVHRDVIAAVKRCIEGAGGGVSR